MGIAIYSKGGLKFRTSYGAFHWMRVELLGQMRAGFDLLYEWAGTHSGTRPIGLEGSYDEARKEYLLALGVPQSYLSRTCTELLEGWMKSHGLGYAWKHFFCHSDCDGKFTAKQCKRLIQDLDVIMPGKTFELEFCEFRELVRNAAERNETLFFS